MESREWIAKKAPAMRGKRELLAHLDGKQITLRQAMLGNCYQCMSYLVDGKADCKMPECTFYPWMPYRDGGPRKRVRRNMVNNDSDGA